MTKLCLFFFRAQHVEKELKAKESQLQSALDVSRWAAQSVESLREELTAVLSRRTPDDPLASGDSEVREMTEKVIAMQVRATICPNLSLTRSKVFSLTVSRPLAQSDQEVQEMTEKVIAMQVSATTCPNPSLIRP